MITRDSLLPRLCAPRNGEKRSAGQKKKERLGGRRREGAIEVGKAEKRRENIEWKKRKKKRREGDGTHVYASVHACTGGKA